jgi:hypothetical protein
MDRILKSRSFITLEFLVLCLLIPAYIIISKNAPFMFAFLWGAALYALVVLYFSYPSSLQDIWKWRAVTRQAMKPLLIRWCFACLAMTAFIWFYDPDRMLAVVYDRPWFVPVLVVVYPVFSALPQELIFCSFFFVRYRIFFGQGIKMVIASAVIFAYAHILYINPVAPILSLIGGYIFATTYLKTRSLALVTIEHGLYGNFLFIIGLGWYFYGGSVQ